MSSFFNNNNYRIINDGINIVFHTKLVKQPTLEEDKIYNNVKRAFLNPINSASLGKLVQNKSKIVLIADDLTRPTKQKILLPALMDELNKYGIKDSMVKIVIALGTHRKMTKREIIERFGGSLVKRIEIINHDCKEESCIKLGFTEQGTPIQVNPVVYNSDFKISIGSIMPHPIAGWTGGGKMIQPGVCSEITTNYTHYIGGKYNKYLDLSGNIDNFVREEIDTIANKVGLDFIINSVNDVNGDIIKIFAGDFISAHRVGVKFAEKIHRPLIGEKADIVITNAYPVDTDYWQGFKALVFSHLALNDGGIIIFFIDAPEGVTGSAPKHRNILLNWADKEPEEILYNINKGIIKDKNCGGMCISHSRLLKRAKVFCISKGISDNEQKKLGFLPFSSIDEAIEQALKEKGKDSKVGIIPFGGYTMVRVKE
jgi:lactate racemase